MCVCENTCRYRKGERDKERKRESKGRRSVMGGEVITASEKVVKEFSPCGERERERERERGRRESF